MLTQKEFIFYSFLFYVHQFVCMYIHVVYVCLLAEEIRRRVSDPVQLELQKVVNLYMHSRNQTGSVAIAASAPLGPKG